MRFFKPCHLLLSILGLALVLTLPNSALAQPENPAQPPAQNAPAEVEEESTSLREQTIYIPYDKLYKVFEQPGRGVFLPYEKFQELWQRANQNAASPRHQQAPLRSLIKVIDSEANVRQDVVVVTATLTIELIGSGWHEVPLNLADAAILSAKLGDADARVIRRGNGYSLLIEVSKEKLLSPAEIQLKLEYAKAFSRTPGLNQFTIQAPQASVNRWKIRVPEKGVKIQVQPMVAASENNNAGD
ncbi:MAG: hypothetical protein VB912_02225, partial [Pirellulaceae bacterium]